jgi:hypothetical protein
MTLTPSTPMSTQSGGLRVREIATTTVVIDGVSTIVPVLDAEGREIELSSVVVPQDIEAEGREAVVMHVAEHVALERAIADSAVAMTAPNPPSPAEGAET